MSAVKDPKADRYEVAHQLGEKANEWPRVAYQTIPWADLFRLEEILAREENLYLTGLNIKRDEDGWFVILKGNQNGNKVVHFTGGRHFTDALESIGWEVAHRALSWRPDKY